MRKRITTIALAAALAASQAVISYAANSPGTGPVIGDNGGDSDYGFCYRCGTSQVDQRDEKPADRIYRKPAVPVRRQ